MIAYPLAGQKHRVKNGF